MKLFVSCVCVFYLVQYAPLHGNEDVSREQQFRPLDKRTQCIVLFREALVLISGKNVPALTKIIADGHGPNQFTVNLNTTPLPTYLKAAVSEPERFLKGNFPHSATIHANFDKILFSDLQTEKEAITVKDAMATAEGREVPFKSRKGEKAGKLYTINIKIPGIKDRRFSQLRFVEADGRLFWVPFGA
jgi:hypothetical protein